MYMINQLVKKIYVYNWQFDVINKNCNMVSLAIAINFKVLSSISLFSSFSNPCYPTYHLFFATEYQHTLK